MRGYAFRGKGTPPVRWTDARDDLLKNSTPWFKRSSELAWASNTGAGPFRRFFLNGHQKAQAKWPGPLPASVLFPDTTRHDQSVHVDFDRQCHQKYQLHIHGHAAATSLKYRLACGSLVFLVENPYTEFWHETIRDFENVVIVKYDGSDLLEKLQWAVDHDNEAQRIAANGAALVENVLSDSMISCYWALVLKRFAQLALKFKKSCLVSR